MVDEGTDSLPGGSEVAGSRPVDGRWSLLASGHRAGGGPALVGGSRMNKDWSDVNAHVPGLGTRVTFAGTRVTFTGTRVTFH